MTYRKTWRATLALMLALCAIPTARLAETVTLMPMSAVTLLSTVGFEDGECRVLDAALLPNGEALLVGNVFHADSEDTDGWAVRIETATGAETWRRLRPAEDGQTYTAAAPSADGFVLVRTDKAVSVLEFWTLDGTAARQVELDAYVTALETGSDGEFAAVGQKDGKPWAARLDDSGELVWEHIRDTYLEAFYACVSVDDGFVYAGGAEPWRVDLMDRFTWSGTWDTSAKENDGGSIQQARGFAWINSGTLIAGGTNDGGDGTTYATASVLSTTLAILAGPYTHSMGSGFNHITSIRDPGPPQYNLAMACGFEARQDMIWSYASVLQDQVPSRVWYIPFGTESEARMLLQHGPDTVLVIGHGNGVDIGAEVQPGVRVYVIEMELPYGITPEANG